MHFERPWSQRHLLCSKRQMALKEDTRVAFDEFQWIFFGLTEPWENLKLKVNNYQDGKLIFPGCLGTNVPEK